MRPAATPELRLVLAVSLDGRLAPAEGGAAQLGGAADRQVLEEALAWADAVLVGAETLRRHGSTCLIHSPALLEARRSQGRAAQPIAIAVSRSGRLPAALNFFRQPLERWLLQAAPLSPAVPAAAPAEGFSRHLPLDGWPEALAALAALGQGRIAVLGGAQLAAALAAEDLLDELQLTVCPRLLGGPHGWLPADASVAPGGRTGWRLVEHRALPGEELLLRWRRPGDQGVTS
ncbi:dihydrofolate reductase family protein [Cyanobium gracile]|uniref:Pyrimidine reductase, riboflavin biosynthesis n=1 Tax=Cyanobium gracile (strain ATCC 27147 / PCC 6307) TaxID=292564 RepID=K9PA89_CYAGP|nr:dihydrofolate reductase family protein [Cyanobium gracile]AFY30045.1 pyrimidine reductase, riboflavin biosynthesis [Cyanobium gracile PCC 6307]